MSILGTIQKLKLDSLQHVYFVYGSETYLIDAFVNKVRSLLFTEADDSMNDSRFQVADTPIQEIVEEAATIPFFSNRKLVVIQDFYFVSTQKVKAKVEHDLSALEQYIQSPSDSTVFIIIAPYEKVDERKKLTKQLKKQTAALESNPLNEEQVKQWMVNAVGEQGFTIDKAAAQLLFARVGSNLMLIEKELEKCMLFTADKKHIVEQDVETLVAETVDESIFSVVESVAIGKTDQALKTYHKLLRQKEEPLAMLALLTRQFRNLLYVKIRQEKGYNQKEIAGQLNLHPYVIKLTMQQTKRHSKSDLRKALIACADTDYAIKTGKGEKERSVELLLLKLSTRT
ncbi:DNA polymerase III subunit delta [Alkalihalobacillus sp. LMS6]|uniref:DNA polymerase III subunit delta n=1 Tax=Bacillaceae TaxID=186817 RepID=UPI000C07688D|nr:MULTISPECIES: DNA polymerase III subunit delta [Bacillaceae]UTR07916.1 DNA polymerase III subunit delta [Alkalihalobacillus sp. LMS6]